MIDYQAAKSRVCEAIKRIKAGKMVILVDGYDRENEGDLIMVAELVTAGDIAFMAKAASGLICLTLESSIVDRLQLPLMQDQSRDPSAHTTAFTVSIEARQGVSTGISAADRTRTIQVAINPQSVPNDLVVPGHIFPLRARDGGVLVRAGHTEGSVDLAKLAGFSGAAVICEIMNDDGTMARMPELCRFAAEHGIFIITIDDLIAYRRREQETSAVFSRSPTLRTSANDHNHSAEAKELSPQITFS